MYEPKVSAIAPPFPSTPATRYGLPAIVSGLNLHTLPEKRRNGNMLQPRNKRKSRLLAIGQREVETHGLETSFWSDLYHRSVTVYWPVFFGSAAAIFVTLNAVFAFFYWLGDQPPTIYH